MLGTIDNRKYKEKSKKKSFCEWFTLMWKKCIIKKEVEESN